VGNNRDRFESIEPHHEELLTGDHRTIIEGYGMMHVKLTKANGSTKILRAHAAYIPGFHTNLNLHQFNGKNVSMSVSTNALASFQKGQNVNASQSLRRFMVFLLSNTIPLIYHSPLGLISLAPIFLHKSQMTH